MALKASRVAQLEAEVEHEGVGKSQQRLPVRSSRHVIQRGSTFK